MRPLTAERRLGARPPPQHAPLQTTPLDPALVPLSLGSVPLLGRLRFGTARVRFGLGTARVGPAHPQTPPSFGLHPFPWSLPVPMLRSLPAGASCTLLRSPQSLTHDGVPFSSLPVSSEGPQLLPRGRLWSVCNVQRPLTEQVSGYSAWFTKCFMIGQSAPQSPSGPGTGGTTIRNYKRFTKRDLSLPQWDILTTQGRWWHSMASLSPSLGHYGSNYQHQPQN